MGQGQPQSESRWSPHEWRAGGREAPGRKRSQRRQKHRASLVTSAGPMGQGDRPDSSTSSTGPQSPGLPGSLWPSLQAASELLRLPKASAEVVGRAP